MIVNKKSFVKNNNFRKLSKISQRDEVAALFQNRTGIKYQVPLFLKSDAIMILL